MINKEELILRIKNGCSTVIAAEAELTDIDAKFGDADHGFTMVKICNAIVKALVEAEGDIKETLDDAAMAVMSLNGGSAVPLWNTWLDGMQEGAPEAGEMDTAQLKTMFARAFEELDDMSGAKVGDKTMISSYGGDSEAELFDAAAKAAWDGAENSKNFPSKFGRAKSYGEKTIGTPDAGAMSMAYFFKGMAQ